MTRRDRAAMVLALEYARASFVVGEIERGDRARARSALRAARASIGVLRAHTGPTFDELWDAAQTADDHGVPKRLLRARLALALRAMLRADAVDFGSMVHDPMHYAPDDWRRLLPFGGLDSWKRVRYTPLWEQAPQTRR